LLAEQGIYLAPAEKPKAKEEKKPDPVPIIPEPPELGSGDITAFSEPSSMKAPDIFPVPPAKSDKKKSGFFSSIFGKKKEPVQKLPEPVIEPSIDDFKPSPIPPPPIDTPKAAAAEEPKNEEIKAKDIATSELSLETGPKLDTGLPKHELTTDDGWYDEGEQFLEKELEEEGEHFLEKGDAPALALTPLSQVKGIGPVSEKKLKKAGIKTAEHIANKDHKSLAKTLKISEKSARQIVTNAKKITKIKEQLKETKKSKVGDVRSIVRQLDEEKKNLDKLRSKTKPVTEDKIIELEGHQDLIEVLQKLENKRKELSEMEQRITEKQTKLSSHDDTYRRDLENLDNLKRRLDHDIRERTQYLINLEKEYFQKAQNLAKQKSEIEMKEKSLSEKEKFLREQEHSVKIRLNEIEDRSITMQTKEQKYQKLMRDLEKQDSVLKEKEQDLLKRESEYVDKLEALETHEKGILKSLEDKRKSLESKEKEIEVREKKISTKQRTVDKKGVAVEYAQNIIEEQKNKLVDDEFEQYLHDQLGVLRNSGISVGDINFAKSISVHDTSDKGNKTIYQLIDTCKDLMKSGRGSDAKIIYNQIRERYYDLDFTSQKEKESVHNIIRSLYDEINLSDIGKKGL
ncbi:MAG: hypothetical protein HGA85_01070, partial [Nanoarchaeota archaeon]|nr:hypothetical protein [Nanoarchaeota archaeon]